ncbi:AbrB family transcriptional regulator [Salmonella enterica]|nr:AbrB family transcriptional regulator [Salmonella enterica]EFO7976583.1 AbrB family transcriptional regulator [Salmonella enterica]
MRTSVRKWGNSRAMIFPVDALDMPGFELGDDVEIIKQDGALLLKPATPVYSLADILAGCKPEDFTMTQEDKEWESMRPVGDEL